VTAWEYQVLATGHSVARRAAHIGLRRWTAVQARQSPAPSREFAREVGYAGPPGVRRAIEALATDETLAERHGALVVADPFFAEWLRRL
jgi:hypothetical protein